MKLSGEEDEQLRENFTSSSSSSASNFSSNETDSSASIDSSQQTSSIGDSSSALHRPAIVSSERVILKQTQVMPKEETGSVSSVGAGNAHEAVNHNHYLHRHHEDHGDAHHSARRYRNSPFGLTHHYLTMPDNGLPLKSAKLYVDGNEDDSDDEENSSAKLETHGTGNKSLSSANEYPDLATSIHDNHTNQSNLSVTVNSSTSPPASLSQPMWLRDEPPINLAKPRAVSPSLKEPIDLLALDGHFTASGRRQGASPSPAGDAGLDARTCNAKDLERGSSGQSYYPSRVNAHEQPYLSEKLKLKSELGQAPESSSLLIRFSSIMYATFLVILGCILHVSELRQKSKNSTDHIYTIVVALVGIIWLLFLQADLQRYKKYATKYILIETIFNDHRQQRRQLREAQSGLVGGDPSARSTTSSSASLMNDRMSMNTEVIFKKTAYKMYQRQAAMDRDDRRHKVASRNHKLAVYRPHTKSHNSTSSQATIADSKELELGRSGLINGDHTDICHPANLVPAYKFLHGKMGANFYLKCGMAAFCFGHVIHEGLRFGQQVYFFATGNVHCRDSAALVAHLVTPLYSFYQLFMMFKYSNLVINRHKVLARFGLMHIIGTSVTFWFRTILEEAFDDFVHKMDYFKANKPQSNHLASAKSSDTDSNLVSLLTSFTNAIKTEASERSDWSYSSPDQQNVTMAQSLLTLMSSPISATITPQMVRHLPDSYACAQNTLLPTKSMNALPYLYPFTIEYNLLLAATFLSLYFNIGKICLPSDTTCNNFRNYSRVKPARSSSSSPGGSHFESSDNSSAIRMRENGLEKDLGEYKSNFVVNADCHSANKGLFCGFFVLLVTLVTIVIFFVTINKPSHVQLGIKINLIQEATLTALILMVTLAGFKQVVKLNKNPYLKDKVTTDDVLMLIPLPFFFIHSLLSFRAEMSTLSLGGSSHLSSMILHQSDGNQHRQTSDSMTLSNGGLKSILLNTSSSNNGQFDSRRPTNNLLTSQSNETKNRFVEEFITQNNSSNRVIRNSNDTGINAALQQVDHFKLITIAMNVIVMIEVLVQTNFIIDGMRRCSESRYLRFKKPGRELITFAILLNITYWIVATFETKSVEQYKTEIEYYGPLPYMFISHTTLPVMLFYRYHSSVCLAEIWNRAYKPPKKR